MFKIPSISSSEHDLDFGVFRVTFTSKIMLFMYIFEQDYNLGYLLIAFMTIVNSDKVLIMNLLGC